MKRSALAAIVLAVLSIGPAALAAAQEGPAAVVRARNSALAAAVHKGDAAAAAGIYATDAEVTQPGERIHRREGVLHLWEAQIKRGVADCEFTTEDTDLTNGVITEKGAFVFKTKAGAVIVRGTYVNTWTREAGQWRIKTNAVLPAAAIRMLRMRESGHFTNS